MFFGLKISKIIIKKVSSKINGLGLGNVKKLIRYN
mgnify:CR=1 FL=1